MCPNRKTIKQKYNLGLHFHSGHIDLNSTAGLNALYVDKIAATEVVKNVNAVTTRIFFQ